MVIVVSHSTEGTDDYDRDIAYFGLALSDDAGHGALDSPKLYSPKAYWSC